MSLVDPAVDGLTKLRNAEMASKKSCMLKPASKFIGEILKVAKENTYIEDYKAIDEKGVLSYEVKLNGRMNTCKGIQPRHAVKRQGFEKFEKRYLPARDVGILVVSTPQGVMSHRDAKKKGIGGRLVAFIY